LEMSWKQMLAIGRTIISAGIRYYNPVGSPLLSYLPAPPAKMRVSSLPRHGSAVAYVDAEYGLDGHYFERECCTIEQGLRRFLL
jgi:hypothetical protein